MILRLELHSICFYIKMGREKNMGFLDNLFGKKSDTQKSGDENVPQFVPVTILKIMIELIKCYRGRMEKDKLDIMSDSLLKINDWMYIMGDTSDDRRRFRRVYIQAFNAFLCGLSAPIEHKLQFPHSSQIILDPYESPGIKEWNELSIIFKNLEIDNIAEICNEIYNEGFFEAGKRNVNIFRFGLHLLD
jgi:hypothetical protein